MKSVSTVLKLMRKQITTPMPSTYSCTLCHSLNMLFYKSKITSEERHATFIYLSEHREGGLTSHWWPTTDKEPNIEPRLKWIDTHIKKLT